jgi:hypothetical protein
MSDKSLDLDHSVSVPPPDPKKLREWWHQLLREYDRYPCCMVFLAFEQDAAAFNYLMRNHSEIDRMSGEHCLVIVLSDMGYMSLGPDRKVWNLSLTDYMDKGYSTVFADIFKVRYEEFPCCLIFKDFHSSTRVKLSIKGLTQADIAEKMRNIFSTIKEAVITGTDPLLAIESDEKQKTLLQNYKTITTAVREISSKALEPAMTAFFKVLIK